MKGKVKKIMTFLVVAGLMAIGAAVIVGLIVGVITGLINISRYISGNLRPASVMATDVPAEGIGRAAVRQYGAFVCAGEAETTRLLETYTDGDSPVPAWYQPDEDMAVEWRQTERHDIGCPDWNVDSTLWGWDGHTAEAWELGLMARILYLEFLGCSRECCEAGVDSILNLWDSGYFSNTLGGTLSATAENGALVYTTYGYVWEWDYDPDDLAWCLSLCEERFYNGPRWNCCFFQLYGYPEWAEPLYCMDGVYFSTGKEW